MTPAARRQDGDHGIPCAYARVMMWVFGVGIAVFGLLLPYGYGRVATLEDAVSEVRFQSARYEAEAAYIRVMLEEIKRDLREMKHKTTGERP